MREEIIITASKHGGQTELRLVKNIPELMGIGLKPTYHVCRKKSGSHEWVVNFKDRTLKQARRNFIRVLNE